VYAAVVGLILAHDIHIDASGDLSALDNSSGGTAWLTTVHTVIFPVMVAFWLSFVARLLLSWRRASIVRRQQLKWLLTGCAISLATGVISVAVGLVPHAPAAVQGAATPRSATWMAGRLRPPSGPTRRITGSSGPSSAPGRSIT
jgi:hypothetical protein